MRKELHNPFIKKVKTFNSDNTGQFGDKGGVMGRYDGKIGQDYCYEPQATISVLNGIGCVLTDISNSLKIIAANLEKPETVIDFGITKSPEHYGDCNYCKRCPDGMTVDPNTKLLCYPCKGEEK